MFVLALVLVAGCGKKKEEAAAPPPKTGSGSAAMAGSATMAGSGSAAMAGSGSAAATAGSADVPTEMDFEGSAKTKITEQNVEAQVKSLEDDLGK